MCGIAGIFAERITPSDVEVVARMCDAMTHRGPDDEGLARDRHSVLGIRRLSIIDLEGGRQPISNETGTVTVTMNGEIYNYRELRDELTFRGHRFATRADTEVLVHLYEEHGIALLQRLNGMFAFSLRDAERDISFLARDRLGIKPLYMGRAGGGLLFASELQALVASGRLGTDLDLPAIAEYLTLGYITDPRTPFRAVRKLPRATYLEIRGGEAREHTYWRAPTGASTTVRSVSDLCEELRFLLQDSLRLQVRADVPVGVYASGGMDSTAIMWAAARNGASLDSFLCEFDGLKADTPYARMAAEATGSRLMETHLSAAATSRVLPRLIPHLDEPLADAAFVPAYLIAKVAVEHVKVILNGTGGDELFGGYGRYLVRGLLPKHGAERLTRITARLSRAGPLGAKAAAALDYRHRFLRRMGLIAEQDARRALGLDARGHVERLVHGLFAECAGADAPGSMMYVDLATYLPGDLLMVLDKMTMAASLEARVPLTDHRLVEFAFQVPGQLRMCGGELKWLLKEALRGEIPDPIRSREKQGFGPPVPAWMSGSFGAASRELVTHPSACLPELLDPAAIRRWIGPPDTVVPNQLRRLWMLLILELWLRTFVKGQDLVGRSVSELARNEDA